MTVFMTLTALVLGLPAYSRELKGAERSPTKRELRVMVRKCFGDEGGDVKLNRRQRVILIAQEPDSGKGVCLGDLARPYGASVVQLPVLY